MIKITKKNFKIDKEIDFVRSKHSNIGAVSTFIGYVRNLNNNYITHSLVLRSNDSSTQYIETYHRVK